jgi:DNA-binding MarR family transcriptional regulator
MVIVVDELERLGYAERRRSAADRRVQDIHLTRAGRSVLERVLEVAESENERTFEALDDDERGQLHDLLLRIASASRDDPAA